ncbi:radical SAM protein [Candidatus Bathyarchaeota archaeon]|nr:radical SAM protein [Candidatus Bathyarchaeota archaeon]
MKIYVTNNGCEVGKLYSSYIQQLFLNSGPTIIKTADVREADLIIFYACGLTETKEEKSLNSIATLKSMMKPSARFFVWGCLSKQNPESLKNKYSGPMLGPSDIGFFEEILRQTTNESKCSNINQIPDANLPIEEEALQPISTIKQNIMYRVFGDLDGYLRQLFFKSNSSTFYLRVAEGCTSHCTYCSERLVWGTVKSKPSEKVISEFESGLEKGYTSFFLCAEDFGAYGVDIGLKATDLLKQIVEVGNGKNYKIIINELSPPYLKNMLSDFEKIFATGKISTLGVQVESGSNRILKLMGRQYKAEEWRNLMLRINRNFPSINLSTHFMVGFPTETEEDFNATMKLLDFPLLLADILIFKYSARPNIPAARLAGQIPQSIIELRARRLQRKFWYTYPLNIAIRYAYSLIKKPTHYFNELNH